MNDEDFVSEMMRKELETWQRIAQAIENQNKLLEKIVNVLENDLSVIEERG